MKISRLVFLVGLGVTLGQFMPEARGEGELRLQVAVASQTNTLTAGVASTNKALINAIETKRKPYVIEGPVVASFRQSRGAKSAGAKGILNLFNPLAPVPKDGKVELATLYTFDPVYLNKSQPRAFRNVHTQEPVGLISLSWQGEWAKGR
jgi:hypothetical protein